MKKATILVLDSRRDIELANLKRLGLLHPDIQRRSDERTEALLAQRDSLQRAIAELPGEAAEDEFDDAPFDFDATIAVSHSIHAAAERRRGHHDVLEKIDAELARVRPWGEFDPETIEELAKHGITVRLYAMSPKDFRKRAPAHAIVLETTATAVRFAVTWSGNTEGRPSPEEVDGIPGILLFRSPEVSPAALRARREEELTAVETAEHELAGFVDRRAALTRATEEVERRLRDEHVRLGMDTAERIAYITGYVPSDSIDMLKQAAQNNGWGTYLRDPDPDDPVPTKVRNPGWIRIIAPVFNFLGVVPGYRERDISLFFLLFFVVFVGMIIGDAGYGTLLLLAGLFLAFKTKGAGREASVLLIVLSLSTMAWGAMSGNWFGFESIAQTAPFKYLVVKALDGFSSSSTGPVQAVCFGLAVAHLSLAHLWNFVMELGRKPRIRAFAQLGWLALVISMYLLVGSLLLGRTFPAWALGAIGGGIVAILVFGQQEGDGFVKGLTRGLGGAFTTVFSVIGAFGDTISYIRLFAVGLASLEIARAFNGIALNIGFHGVGAIFAVLVLIAGHTLNLIMGALAVMVHGVRLNLLEFSGHLGMEWTGIEYRPYSVTETAID